MVETPDLDTLLGIATPQTTEQKNDALGMRLLAVREQLAALKAEQTQIEDAIWTQTPEEPGEFAVAGEQLAFTVARSEVWKWESAKLEKLAAAEAAVSTVVKSKFTMSKTDYAGLVAALTPQQVKELDAALTRKAGAPRIKITRKA